LGTGRDIQGHWSLEYNNIPMTWKCHKDVCRVDGFANIDFSLISDREISLGAPKLSPTAVVRMTRFNKKMMNYTE
jgi:hypothetical protein